MADTARIKYLRVALGTVTPLAPLSADDTWRLCDVGYFSVDCKPKPAREPEPYLVHGVVHRSARRNHGCTSFGEPRADRSSLG